MAPRETQLDAQIFGSRHYGAISGAVALGANGARAVAPLGARCSWWALGSSERVFWVLTASLLAVSVAVFLTSAEVEGGESRAPRDRAR